jgi:hypothetical protein
LQFSKDSWRFIKWCFYSLCLGALLAEEAEKLFQPGRQKFFFLSNSSNLFQKYHLKASGLSQNVASAREAVLVPSMLRELILPVCSGFEVFKEGNISSLLPFQTTLSFYLFKVVSLQEIGFLTRI